MKKLILSLFLGIFLFSTINLAQQNKLMPLPRLSNKAAIARLEKDIPRLMKEADIPGMGIALIRDGKLIWSKGFGVINAATRQPVTGETVFEANSLSKVVFAYAALTLVDQGKLDLDTPLIKYMDSSYHISDDPRLNLITARMVLSHKSGIRSDGEDRVRIEFNPGEKFEYSPVGIGYLSKVVEKITNMKIEDFMQQAVLKPLGMKDSSYIWQDKYDKLRSYTHDGLGNVTRERDKRTVGAACCSLQTTPDDYARFVIAVMNGELLKKTTWEEMLKPEINVNEKSPEVFWGLGWGLELTGEGKSFWHWGDGGDSKSYITAFLPQKDAVIFFANATNGLSFAQEILADAIGGRHPGIAWLNYDRYDSPSQGLLKSIIAKGADSALKDYQQQRKLEDAKKSLEESQINAIGYLLLNAKKIDDAIQVFTLNTIDFPQSGNTWDSLAEAYMNKGNKELAIEYYEKSLKLDPKNTNAVEMLKKLKDGQ